ncbi:uncharacterized protein [Prorops nasuta]|uniref:uncharacterized protein n=1 Tax=Prorops nasuta TaxID=863751 RepID=UPI0034CE7C08
MGCFRDSAVDFVKDVAGTEANYASTWSTLKDRFSNLRLQVYHLTLPLIKGTPLKKESASGLRTLVDDITHRLRMLKNLGRPVEHWNDLLIILICERLDPVTRKAWKTYLSTRGMNADGGVGMVTSRKRPPSLREMIDFLEGTIQALLSVETEMNVEKSNHSKQAFTGKSRNVVKAHNASFKPKAKGQSFNSSTLKCPLCSAEHYIGRCEAFMNMKSNDRHNEIRRLGLCFNCLDHHQVRNCASKRVCKRCQDNHHTLLHNDRSQGQSDSNAVATVPPIELVSSKTAWPSSMHSFSAQVSHNRSLSLLPTAEIVLIGAFGQQVRARALLDQDSEISFVSESLVQFPKLNRQRVNIRIVGVGAAKSVMARSCVSIRLKSVVDKEFEFESTALVLARPTGKLPSCTLPISDWSSFTKFQWVDTSFHVPGEIDLILGVEVYATILKLGLYSKSIRGSDFSQHKKYTGILRIAAHTSPEVDDGKDISEILKSFWRIEEVPISARILSQDDELCERLFVDNHSRTSSGRYIVKIPLKAEPPSIVENIRRVASNSFVARTKRCDRDPVLAREYFEFMREYEELGYMCRIPENEISCTRACTYHTTRRTADQLSLNDYLLSGPSLQSDLSLILLGWREHRFLFTADIVKMFRQIGIDASDQDLQRIVWSPIPGQPPHDYRLTTVTYVASDEGARYPVGANCLLKQTYVDDIFSGAETLSDVIQIRDQLISILKPAGITLNKWAANSSAIIPNYLDLDRVSDSRKEIDIDRTVKTLGLLWNSILDSFGFKDLWILKVDWDAVLPSDILKRWSNYCHNLSRASEITVNRWLGSFSNTKCLCAYCQIESGTSRNGYNTEFRVVWKFSETFRLRLGVTVETYWPGLGSTLHNGKFLLLTRVSYIQTELPNAVWKYVPSHDNPADLATRGLDSEALKESTIWWHGPGWLQDSSDLCPEQPLRKHPVEVEFSAFSAIGCVGEDPIVTRFSTITKLTRVVAYCLRFVYNFRNSKVRQARNLGYLTSKELERARIAILRLAQSSAFKDELVALKANRPLTKRSVLYKL